MRDNKISQLKMMRIASAFRTTY